MFLLKYEIDRFGPIHITVCLGITTKKRQMCQGQYKIQFSIKL